MHCSMLLFLAFFHNSFAGYFGFFLSYLRILAIAAYREISFLSRTKGAKWVCVCVLQEQLCVNQQRKKKPRR